MRLTELCENGSDGLANLSLWALSLLSGAFIQQILIYQSERRGVSGPELKGEGALKELGRLTGDGNRVSPN